MDELVLVGSIGLVMAMNRFDPDAGHRFASFAGPNIAGEIRRHFRDHTWDVHVPRSLQELDARVHGATRAIRADTGREPSDDDLAAALEITPGEVREGRAAGRAYRALSLDVPAGEGQDSADSHGVTEPGYPRVEDAATIEEAMGALDARERSLVDMRFHEDLLQREIADRVGLSQMQVSRLLTGALEKMTAHVAAGCGASAALAH
jgi:RNA polymerase sigma-B factor